MTEPIRRIAESSPTDFPDTEKGVACYTTGVLASYDVWVLGLVCRFVWRCSRASMRRMYDRNVGARHLDAGPGTGYFLDHCNFPVADPKIALVDLHEGVLKKSADRICRYRPTTYQRDILQPLDLGDDRYDSAGMNFLLHCIPGGMSVKAVAFDRVAAYVRPGGRIFGCTVLSEGVRHNPLAKKALESLNEDDTMSNLGDSFAALDTELAKRFDRYTLTRRGSAAMFEITV